MKEITIKLYSFEELSEDAKKVAINNNRKFQVDHDWWDCTYDDFVKLCNIIKVPLVYTYGKNVKTKIYNISFSGFYHQGSYSAFECAISTSDVFSIIENFESQNWKKEFPKLEITMPSLTKNWKQIKKAENQLDFIIDSKCAGRGCFSVSSEWTLHNERMGNDGNWLPHPNVELVCDEICEWVEQLLKELNSILYKWLQEEYEYRTSDECVSESLIANECEFLEDGTYPRY